MKFYDKEKTWAKINAKRAAKGLPQLSSNSKERRAQIEAETAKFGDDLADLGALCTKLSVHLPGCHSVPGFPKYAARLRELLSEGATAGYEYEEETVTLRKGGSSAGRTLVGGALLGPVGAIAGHASQRNPSELHIHHFVITVTAADKQYKTTTAPKRKSADVQAFVAAFNAASTAQPETPPASASTDPAARLAQAAQLHDAGLLTDTEYETKRAEVVAAL